MAIKIDPVLNIACSASKEEINLHIEQLATHGPAGESAIEVLRQIASCVELLDSVTGTIRLIVHTDTAGMVTKRSAALDITSENFLIPISDSLLSIRSRRSLALMKIETLGELAGYSEKAPLEKCLPVDTLDEIRNLLHTHGLDFASQATEQQKNPTES